MPRSPRILVENGFYHVINRGAARRYIFLSDELKTTFLTCLELTCYRYQFSVFAFCIMGNHYHLLMKTEQGNLDKGMRYLNSTYAQKFNKIRKKDGPVFKDRYKSILVQDEKYLLNISRYIHRNPVEAGIVEIAEHYPWSSCNDYLEAKSRFSWLNPFLSRTNPIDYSSYLLLPNNKKIKDIYSKMRLPSKL